METPRIPENENIRLEVLKNYSILDSLPEKEYDAITKIASSICNTSIALVSIVDKDRQWFKSTFGIEATETPREISFCAHSILNPDELFVVNDATKDERFFDNPLTVNAPNVIFYAGAPLNSSEGYPLGTLCVIDNKPHELNENQREALLLLSKQVVALLELRKKNKELEASKNKVVKLNEQLNNFANRLTHDLKSPINGISFLLDVLKQDYTSIFENTEAEEYLTLIADRIVYVDSLITEILNYSKVTSENIVYENVNLKELLDKIVNNIDFENKILLDTTDLNFEIICSKIGLVQVFQNLISNSRKFYDEDKSEITVSFKEDQDYYYFTYEDNGPGIEEKYWTKVFDMFETLGTKNNNSTGIGLATVKSIIKRLGGKIELKKRDDNKKGVCFYFYISKKENHLLEEIKD
ncbi:GAF domain-containing sensor histidine kinase [Polaribacter sargassicola]|uniref:GAF domain-containing sensor histidine kinase n=1 Tax=Polaribacter sargassicola TaxID=2836891 RepID=UPI001F260AD5|nr:GAF domain-containing sensor histidine kinase [Polaribacter sp. DS7-9]MCG1036624.1 GAF domain-containing sensor histidine kinase [Polaribacter sp. DS7-9]